MSALEDVQKSLNAIRRISRDANSLTQHKILELILQTSISTLKALAAAHKPSTTRKPIKPPPLPIPKAKASNAPQQSTDVHTTDVIPDADALKQIKPQAPIS